MSSFMLLAAMGTFGDAAVFGAGLAAITVTIFVVVFGAYASLAWCWKRLTGAV